MARAASAVIMGGASLCERFVRSEIIFPEIMEVDLEALASSSQDWICLSREALEEALEDEDDPLMWMEFDFGDE